MEKSIFSVNNNYSGRRSGFFCLHTDLIVVARGETNFFCCNRCSVWRPDRRAAEPARIIGNLKIPLLRLAHQSGLDPSDGFKILRASWRRSAGTRNSAVPQSKQTMSSGKTHTTGLSMFFSPGKWMPISPVNLLWLTDAHDLQGILLQLDPNRNQTLL